MLILINSAMLLSLFLTSCLIVGWVIYIFRPAVKLEELLNNTGYALLLIFLITITLITIYQQQIPILNPGQVVLFLAGMTWFGHCTLQVSIKQKVLSLLPLGTILILIITSICLGIETRDISFEPLFGIRSAIHVSFAMLGLSMLIGSGIFASGYLLMNRQLKTHNFGVWFKHLPSLMDMNRLRTHSLCYGWIAITLLIIIASVWTLLTPSSSHVIPSHVHPTVLIWVITGVLGAANRYRWLKTYILASLSLATSVLVLALLFVSLIEFFSGRFL
jgi:ABC-type transport system involved in cytochrome c biogenesis permease subunit